MTLNIDHPSVRQALRNRQDMHKNLMKAFPCGADEAGVLYRLVQKRDALEVLMLSKVSPVYLALSSKGFNAEPGKDLSALPSLYREGAELRFSLLACPSKKKAALQGGNSRRVFLTDPAERSAWLARQGEKYGFAVLECHEVNESQTISISRASGSFKISATAWVGVLRITDADHFWEAWQEGIGPEKAYGLGLMLLSR